jgi:serine/threonine-protein kinase
MKSCSQCQRVYPDDAGFCPADGNRLVNASMVPVAASDDPRIGALLCGRYEIRRVVADGGMGRVYEGIDKRNNSKIAVKVLHDDVAKDEVALERFKREYEISANLPHEHIVKVYDFQKDDASNAWLLVMEYLDGEELRPILKKTKTLPPERLIRMLSQVAVGLDGAHARNFVHRDLKPDNLFLCGTREGDNVKILDFGSVKDTNKDAKKLTVLGTTIGSPFYMAPEQAQGSPNLDARADVFALAAITYECVTGRVPFEGNNGPSILLAILTKDPDPPSVKAAGLANPPPPAMDDVMEVALAKNPNIRTRSVGELADAVGHAYGLEGGHRQWAILPQQQLAGAIATAKDRVMRPKVVPLDVASDPFAAKASTGTVPLAQAMSPVHNLGPNVGPGPGPAAYGPQGGAGAQHGARAMDGAFSAVREAAYEDASAAGIPQERPPWLLPVIVGVVALLVGGGIALVWALAS